MSEETKEIHLTDEESVQQELLQAENGLAEGAEEDAEPDCVSVRAVTHINQKSVSALTRHIFLSQRAVYVLFGVTALAFTVLGAAIWWAMEDAILGISVIAAGILIPPALFFVNLLVIKKLAPKTFQVRYRTVQEFSFGSRISVVEKSDVANGKTNAYEWLALLKAVEKEEYFFLFLDAGSAFIIEKSGFSLGAPDEFRTMLRERIGDKFKE